MKPISKRKFLQLLRDKEACPYGYDLAKGYLKKHTVEQLVEYYYRCKVWRDNSGDYSVNNVFFCVGSIRAERARNLNWLLITLRTDYSCDQNPEKIINTIREACK